MTVPTGTIDLGELPRDRRPEVDAPWPVLARLRHWHDRRRTGRLLGTAAVTVLVLLTVAGAAGPVRPAFQRHFTAPAAISYESDQQNLYVIEARGSDRSRLVAYRLAGGTVRWQAPLPDSGQSWPMLSNGVLLVQSFPGPTTAFDPGTGRELWRRPGPSLLDTTIGGRFVFSDVASGPVLEPDARPAHEFAGVDPVTGRAEWTMSVFGGNYLYGYPDSPYLVAYSQEGDIHSYDLTSGEQLASSSVPSAEFEDVQLVGSLALLRDRRELTAYDVETLTPQWTARMPGSGSMWPVQCGELVCLIGEQLPRALDPATGELVWSADRLPAPEPDTLVTVSHLAGERLAGHLLVTAQPDQGSYLVDARTGELVVDLQRWHPTRHGPLARTDPDPWLIRPAADGVVVGELRPDLSGVRLVGQLGAPPESECATTGGYVFCSPAPSGEEPQDLAVWRYRLR